MSAQEYSVRRASIEDLDIIVQHRRAMLLEIRNCDEAALNSMCASFRPWLEAKMTADEYLGWFAVAPDGSVAAGVGLWIIDWPPHILPNGITGDRRGYILNVYTEHAHRLHGLSRKLMAFALDWCRENGIATVGLLASSYGRPLYESLGFAPTNEMRLTLDQ